MKKTFPSLTLALALATLGTTANATETYNGRISGMSGAGVVTSGYSDGVLLNPSLAASAGERDDFALVINSGVLATDKDNLADAAEELTDYLDYLNTIEQQNLTQDNADKLIDLLNDVDGKQVQVTGGGSLVVAIPLDFLSLAIVSKANISAGLVANLDDGDVTLIEDAINSPFDPDTLVSTVSTKGVLVSEIGLAMAKTIAETEDRKILVGITPKKVNVETFVYDAVVAEFDEDDFNGDDYIKESSATSMDAGVTYVAGKLRYGLVMTNLMSKKFKTIGTEEFELSRQTTAAVGYVSDMYTVEAALDLMAAEAFGLNGDTKIFRAGIEVRPFSWLQLRGGIQRDTEDTLADTYSFGLGISPFDVVNLDVAAFAGANESIGGAAQLGLRF